jgi:hypothetical protein
MIDVKCSLELQIKGGEKERRRRGRRKGRRRRKEVETLNFKRESDLP